MPAKNETLYTFPFILLCLSNILFAGSFSMIIPELPAFLTSMGGEDYKGFIISLFTLSAGLSRPISGKLTDTVGRMPVMIIGTLVCVVCSLMYPLLTTIAGFLLLRFFHGFSTGFKPTAATAFAADIIPIHRRGEGMGIVGISMNIGASLFPPVGSFLVNEFSTPDEYNPDVMFYFSSVLALVSIAILMGMKETIAEKQKFRWSLLKLTPAELIEPKAIPIGIMTILIYLSLGVLLTISPDQADHLGLGNKGMIFTSFTIFTILSRFVAGKVSDRFGRIPVILASVILLVLALVYMGLADSVFHLMLACGALGFSTGIAAPALFAWVIDISPEDRRGRYMATVYIALEIGIGVGALLSAWIFANNTDFFGRTYFVTAGLTALGLVYLWWYVGRKRAVR